MRRFENTDGGASKFWAVEVDGTKMRVTFGKLGTSGQTKDKAFPSAAAATSEAERLVQEKVKKGYREISVAKSSSPKQASPKPASSAAWLKHPDLATEREKLAKRCKSAGLLQHLPAIEALALPAISLLAKKSAPKELCVGRIGGAPDLPASMGWPVLAKRPLGFVAQLDLRALAAFDLQKELPRSGLLSFFAQLDPNKPRYGSASVVQHVTGSTTSRPDANPWGSKRVGWLTPKLRLSLPYYEDKAFERLGLSDDERESYHDEVFLAFAPDERAHQRHGLAPPGPGPRIKGHRLLAQFDSDDTLDFDIGDFETLRFLLEPAAWRSFDLSRVTCTMEMA